MMDLTAQRSLLGGQECEQERQEALAFIDRYGMMSIFRQYQECCRTGDWDGIYD